MPKKLVLVLAAGTIGLSGLAVSAPALAAGAHSSHTRTATSADPAADALTTALAALVSNGTLTQAQADKVTTALKAAAPGRGGRGGDGREGKGDAGADLSAAATALGLSEADLRTALRSGKTLAQVAQAHNVTVDSLVQALVDAQTARIARDVAAGKLTQAQADKRLAGLSARITERVSGTRPEHADTPGGQGRGKDSTPAPTASPSPSS